MSKDEQVVRHEAEDVVWRILSRIMCTPKEELQRKVSLSERLVKDLEICSDDLSFILIEMVDDWLGEKTKQQDWDDVWTIQDVIELAIRKKKRLPTQQS